MSEILEVLKNYQFYSAVDTVERMKGGNINKTYKIITADGERFVLQRINTSVFKDPESLMQNIIAVTDELKKAKSQKTLDKTEVLNIKFTISGKSLAQKDGRYYRMYDYMGNAVTYSVPDDEKIVSEAGRAFGNFVATLSTSRVELKELLKDFHNTSLRIENLLRAYDACKGPERGESAGLCEYISDKQEFVRKLGRISEKFPKLIVHGDTKCDNVVFDRETRKAIGIIDLDTVMRGLVLYDFGDGARSICSATAEDEKDISKVKFDLARFKAFSEGYAREVKDILTEEEKLLMPYGPLLAAIELSARFLTDYLEGNVYFQTGYPRHNLDRAACQCALARDIEAKLADIKKILNEIWEN